MSEFDATKEAEKLAKDLKKETSIVPMHRTMDGALNGYSVIKSAFDIQHCTENQSNALDAMHEWIATPMGLATTLGTSLFFTAFAYFASLDEKKDRKTNLSEGWKITREGLQAGRNGFKAVRGAILTADIFTTQDLTYTILPSGLALGGLYMANRLYMLSVNDKRKKLINTNQQIFAQLMNYGTFLECKATLSHVKDTSHFKNKYVHVEKPALKFIYYDKQGKARRDKDNKIEFIKNRYIFYKNPKGKEQLYYADNCGNVEIINQIDISEIKTIIQKTGTAHLSLLQLNELLPRGMAK